MYEQQPHAFNVPGQWDAAVLAPVAEINEQLLALLCAAAATPAHATPRLINALRQQWSALTPPLQKRLAACPYLLIDAGFSQPERWAQAYRPGVMDGSPRGYFATAAGVVLARRTLLLAWHLARSNPLAARVVLGMSSPCAELIAAWRLHDLETLAEFCPPWIAPRWEDQPQVWEQLLHAGCRDNSALLRQTQLRGLQLLAGRYGASPPLC